MTKKCDSQYLLKMEDVVSDDRFKLQIIEDLRYKLLDFLEKNKAKFKILSGYENFSFNNETFTFRFSFRFHSDHGNDSLIA